MARCLKPGGRLVLSEPDQGTHIVAAGVSRTTDEIFERLRQHRRTKFRNPLIGRALPRLVVDAGLTVVKTWATPIVYPTLQLARRREARSIVPSPTRLPTASSPPLKARRTSTCWSRPTVTDTSSSPRSPCRW